MKQHWFEWRIVREDGQLPTNRTKAYATAIQLPFRKKSVAEFWANYWTGKWRVVRVKVTVQQPKKVNVKR